jgi:hypothetical protein
MLTTLAFAAALGLAPAQAGGLQLINARPTFGILGPVRSNTSILPGDIFSLAFDIQNLTADKEGKILYSMGMEVINPQGRPEYKRDPGPPVTIFNVLGGNRIPAFANAKTDPETAPGEYTLRVTVIDAAAKNRAPATVSKKFTVLPKAFGIVRLSTNYSLDGRIMIPAPAGGVAGQSLFLTFMVANFSRDGTGQTNVHFQMTVRDEQGNLTVPQPIEGDTRRDKVPADYTLLPEQFPIPLNRVGKFTLTLKAADLVGKKTSEVTIPITVVGQK